MSKKTSKMVLGLAVTALIGTGAVAGNSFLVSSALATTNSSTTPVIKSDVIAAQSNTRTGQTKEAEKSEAKTELETRTAAIVVTADDNGKQTIVSDESLTKEQKLQLERDLEGLRKDLEGGVDASEDTAPIFVAGTPSKSDLTKEEAIKTAETALIEKFALTDETLSRFSIDAAFNVADPKAPVWSITFYPTNQSDYSKIGNYNITIYSLSGDIIEILTAADGVG